MKKHVLLSVLLILVSLLSLTACRKAKDKEYDGLKKYGDVIYVEKIEITSDHEIEKYHDEDMIYLLNEFKSDGTRTVKLNCEVKPDNADNKKIRFMLEAENTWATVDENGLITVKEPGTHVFPVYIVSDENPTISHKIVIWAVDTSDFE